MKKIHFLKKSIALFSLILLVFLNSINLQAQTPDDGNPGTGSTGDPTVQVGGPPQWLIDVWNWIVDLFDGSNETLYDWNSCRIYTDPSNPNIYTQGWECIIGSQGNCPGPQGCRN